MRSAVDELWSLVQRRGAIDAMSLFDVLAKLDRRGDDEDVRTRLLIRESRRALSSHFGGDVVASRLGKDVRFTSEDESEFRDGRGFPLLASRVENATDPQTLYRMLRELGLRTREPVTLIVGGSLTLMLDSIIVRKTDDVDLVDEVPASIREQPTLVDELAETFGLRLTHFQSHYLPHGWQERTHSIGKFGSIDARRVDPIDALVAKLFSKRKKDFKDLLEAFSRVDRENFADRVRHTTADLRSERAALEAATEHWYILTGEETLPS